MMEATTHPGDNMQILREITELNKAFSKVEQVVNSALDLQSKMLACESNVNSPQVNTDFVVGNLDTREIFIVLRELEIGRECFAIGAPDAGLSFFHGANEQVVISRSKFGFMAKNLRSSFTQQATSIKEETGGFTVRRSKEVR